MSSLYWIWVKLSTALVHCLVASSKTNGLTINNKIFQSATKTDEEVNDRECPQPVHKAKWVKISYQQPHYGFHEINNGA